MLPQVDGGGRGWGRQTLNKMSDKSDTKEGRKEDRKEGSSRVRSSLGSWLQNETAETGKTRFSR